MIARQLILSVALSSLILILGSDSAVAAKPRPEGCQFQGSWIGYFGDFAYWVSTADGQSSSSGTYRLEVPGFLKNLPGAERASVLRGNWERIDDYTFRFTVVGIVVDSTGSALYVVKVSGYDTLAEDCNSMSIYSSTEIFWGDQNPFVDEPFNVIYPVPHTGYRMRIDPPVDPPATN